MTYIKKMKMSGFKSFAKPIDLPFSRDFSAIIGPNGSGKCLVGDSLVMLSDGSLTKIRDLVNPVLEKKHKKIDDGFIAQGDGKKILSLNLNTLRIEKKPILTYVKRTSPKTLLSLRTKSGKNITATKYHPLFILDNGNVRSIKAEELKEGIKIAIPNKISINPDNLYFEELLEEIKPSDNLYVKWKKEYKDILLNLKEGTWKEFSYETEIPLTILKGMVDGQNINLAYLIKILKHDGFQNNEIMNKITHFKAKNAHKYCKIPWKNSSEFSRFFGYLLSEGRLPKYSDQIWFTNGTEEIVKDYVELFEKLFETKPTVNEYKPKCYDVIGYSQPIRIFLSKFGMPIGGKTGQKTITNLYLKNASNETLAELLNGLYCGDGYISKSGVEITTKSKALGFAIETILSRLGMDYRSVFHIKVATNTGFSGVYKTIRIYGVNNLLKFKNKINLIHKKKRKRLSEIIRDKKANPNLDLIELNTTVKNLVKELKIKIKPNRKRFPRLDSYCYNGCTPSRHGLRILYEELFKPLAEEQTQSLQLLQKHIESNIFWDEIVEINEIKSKEKWVYDLCIEKNHNFIANNVIVHNSNVVDSLCFVLGRLSSKSMRADNSAKLIYNGGKKGKPSKEAYVSILFDNTTGFFPAKAKEIEVKRVVRHTGSSKYYINGELRTRQQILDLLGAAKINPDGHNIILQGDITHAAEMPTEERRQIIEHIAGISIYEDKKEKAVKELEKVDVQLKEVNIVISERGTYLKELKKDYEQASRYKDLEKNVSRNKATYLTFQVKQKQERLNKVLTSMNKNQTQIDSINKNISQIQENTNTKQKDLDKINSTIEQSGESSQKALHKEIETLKDSLNEDKTRLSTLQNEIRSLNERKSQLRSSLQDSDKRVSSFQQKKSDLKKQIEVIQKQEGQTQSNLDKLKEKHNLDDLETDLGKIDLDMEDIKSQNLEEKKLELLREKDRTELRLNTINKIANKKELKRLADIKKKFKSSTELLNKLTDQDTTFLNQLSSARIKMQQMREEQARLKTRQSLAKESSYNSAINRIKSSGIQGIHGTFAELTNVPSQYSMAIEVAAGSRLNSIIVKDDKTAARCIEYLKSKRLGTAIFLPLNKLRTSPPRKTNEGHGLALDLIKFDSKFKPAFNYVLGSTLVVDNIDSARKIGIGKHRMVTLEGDLIEASGAMIGGFRRKRSSSFLSPDIDKNLGTLNSELIRLKSIIQTLDKDLALNENKISKTREEKSTLEGEILKIQATIGNVDDIEQERDNLAANLKTSLKNLRELDSNLEKNAQYLKELNKRRSILREKISKKRNPKIISEIESLEKQIQTFTEKKIMLSSEINNLSSQIDELILPEKESMSRIIKQNISQLEQFNQEINQLQAIITDKSKDIREKERQEAKLYSSFKGLLTRREKLNEQLQKHELKTNNEQNKIQLFEERINTLSLDKAKINSELQGLQEQLQEFKNVSLRKGLTEAQLRDEISKFESLMRNLGNVNLRALEIYEQVQDEYKSLETKSEKLGNEKSDVLKMIEEVESKKTNVFMKSFNEINKNFETVFSQLTVKGTTAHLVLDNPEKPLEGGVQIMVKIAQNKFLDIKSLSGGEKTMTALAFIFSIQEHDPAPFYLLDEVDAALDKKNSEKLSELVKKYSEKAQYIVITHNDSVISGADKLYGVSMHKDGMSHVVSLKV